MCSRCTASDGFTGKQVAARFIPQHGLFLAVLREKGPLNRATRLIRLRTAGSTGSTRMQQ